MHTLMADVKRELKSYEGQPLHTMTTQQLANFTMLTEIYKNLDKIEQSKGMQQGNMYGNPYGNPHNSQMGQYGNYGHMQGGNGYPNTVYSDGYHKYDNKSGNQYGMDRNRMNMDNYNPMMQGTHHSDYQSYQPHLNSSQNQQHNSQTSGSNQTSKTSAPSL